MVGLPMLTDTQKKMIEEFQCPGCVCGSDTECGSMKLIDSGGFFYCEGHVIGTMIFPLGSIILGLPKGFDRVGRRWEAEHKGRIRLWAVGQDMGWNHLNVPVWALEKDGYLFVRTYMPRVNYPVVDVVEGGTLALCPQAINVAEFVDQID